MPTSDVLCPGHKAVHGFLNLSFNVLDLFVFEDFLVGRLKFGEGVIEQVLGIGGVLLNRLENGRYNTSN